jgi:hypothetical protein
MATQILIRNSKDSLLLLEKCKKEHGIQHVSMFVKSDISLAVVIKIDDLLDRTKSQLSDLHYSNVRLWHWELHADHTGINSIWLDTCTWDKEKEGDELFRAEKHLQAFMEDEQQEEE